MKRFMVCYQETSLANGAFGATDVAFRAGGSTSFEGSGMLKVLFFNRHHSLWMGGDAMQLDATRCALEALGVQTTYSSDLTIDLMPFDVVHLFHLNFQ